MQAIAGGAVIARLGVSALPPKADIMDATEMLVCARNLGVTSFTL